MSTRTFLGLIFLIAMLFVASVPQLLDPAARGVEQLAVQTGVLDAKAPHSAGAAKEDAAVEDPAESRLALRGFVVEEDGDLRDTIQLDERGANERGRLLPGATRSSLPGERADADGAIPPAASEDGVLLDVTGCPMFRPGTDVATLLATPETQALYAAKVADADVPEACDVALQERITTATESALASPLGAATERERAAIRRGGTSAMIVGLSEIALLSQLMDDEELQDALAALEES